MHAGLSRGRAGLCSFLRGGRLSAWSWLALDEVPALSAQRVKTFPKLN